MWLSNQEEENLGQFSTKLFEAVPLLGEVVAVLYCPDICCHVVSCLEKLPFLTPIVVRGGQIGPIILFLYHLSELVCVHRMNRGPLLLRLMSFPDSQPHYVERGGGERTATNGGRLFGERIADIRY